MLPSDSPFPDHPHTLPVPFELRGDFAWLAAAPVQAENAVGAGRGAGAAGDLPALQAAAAQLGVRLPDPFVLFMGTPALHARVRSNTDCFLDLAMEPVPSPGGGHLVRFLADSQGCLFWYLYLTPDGSDHAVVSSPESYDADAEDEPDPTDVAFWAESFEAFVCRFWLENEVWFADHLKTPLPAVPAEFIEQYRTDG